MTSPPPGYRGYLPADGLTARPSGFSEVAEQPLVEDLDPHDPLINPSSAGLDGWWRRVRTVIAANRRSLFAIVVIGYALPTLALAVVPARAGLPVLGVLVAAYLQAVTWGAVVWAITQWATGTPPSPGGALTYGFRRSPLLFRLNLLVTLMVAVGTVALVVPGLYLWFATSLVLPAAVFRQERPVGASFGLFHRFTGPMLARVGLAAGGPLLLKVLVILANLAGVHGAGYALAALTVQIVVGVPLQILAIVGLTLAHVEMTGRNIPITSASLFAAL
jgi:hypothetical protein